MSEKGQCMGGIVLIRTITACWWLQGLTLGRRQWCLHTEPWATQEPYLIMKFPFWKAAQSCFIVCWIHCLEHTRSSAGTLKPLHNDCAHLGGCETLLHFIQCLAPAADPGMQDGS